MRLSPEAQQIIRQTTKEIFGEKASVSLFGSRTNDELKGGDIDLLVESDQEIKDRQQKQLQLVARLQLRLGDQPIDVIVIDPSVNQKAIHQEATQTSVKL